MNRQKQCFREKLLVYMREHSLNGRIPSIDQMRIELKTTNYLLMRYINEFVFEHILRKGNSRKEGIYFSETSRPFVIGILLETGRPCEYINSSDLFTGFFSIFRHNRDDFILRTIQLPKLSNLSAVIKDMNLDFLVAFGCLESVQKVIKVLPQEILSKVLFNIVDTSYYYPKQPIPVPNLICLDWDFWYDSYIKAAKGHYCTHFIQFSENDSSIDIFAENLKKNGLEWNKKCAITKLSDLHRKLPILKKKYNIDAIRCSGGKFWIYWFNYVQDHPEESLYMPVYGWERQLSNIRKLGNSDIDILFESLEDFLHYWGVTAGETVVKLLKKEKVNFPLLLKNKLLDQADK